MRRLDGSDDLEVLLHLHRRIGRWLQPGGHVDGVETPLDAARRETVEETGIATRPVDGFLLHVDVHETPNGHIHLDMRYLLSPIDPAAGPAPGPEESQQVRWFLLREAQAFADPGLTGALAGAAGRLGMTESF